MGPGVFPHARAERARRGTSCRGTSRSAGRTVEGSSRPTTDCSAPSVPSASSSSANGRHRSARSRRRPRQSCPRTSPRRAARACHVEVGGERDARVHVLPSSQRGQAHVTPVARAGADVDHVDLGMLRHLLRIPERHRDLVGCRGGFRRLPVRGADADDVDPRNHAPRRQVRFHAPCHADDSHPAGSCLLLHVFIPARLAAWHSRCRRLRTDLSRGGPMSELSMAELTERVARLEDSGRSPPPSTRTAARSTTATAAGSSTASRPTPTTRSRCGSAGGELSLPRPRRARRVLRRPHPRARRVAQARHREPIGRVHRRHRYGHELLPARRRHADEWPGDRPRVRPLHQRARPRGRRQLADPRTAVRGREPLIPLTRMRERGQAGVNTSGSGSTQRTTVVFK